MTFGEVVIALVQARSGSPMYLRQIVWKGILMSSRKDTIGFA